MSFHLTFNLNDLRSLASLPETARREMRDAAQKLSVMAKARALELARDKLRTRRQAFVDNLSVFQESDDTWVLVLAASAMFIEEGLPPGFDMLEGLLKSPKARQGKNGRYVVVPFRHGPAQQATPPQQDLISTIRAELKRQNIPWAGIERDEQGRPRYGRLHSLNINDKPLKTGQGPGQGWGPVGDVRQGPNARQRAGGGPGGGGTPFLAGTSIYQRPDASTKSGARRDILTFRVASESQRGTGLWKHPGAPPVKILDEVHAWLGRVWETEVAPAVLERIRNAT